MRGPTRPLALLCAALLAVVATFASSPDGDGGGGAPRLEAVAAAGPVELVNSREGQAVLTAGGLAPGDWVGGTVWLRNDGGTPGRLSFARGDLVDVPGAGGGLLGPRLQLGIRELDGARARFRWAGALDSSRSVPLGTIGAGRTRAFHLTVLFPDGGTPPGPLAGDNALAGASARVRFDWRADGLAAGSGPGPSRPLDRRPPRLRLRLARRQRVLRRGYLRLIVACDVRCRLRAVSRGRAAGRGVATPLARRRLRASRLTRLRLRFGPRSRARLRRALRLGRGARLRLRVRARDAAGNSTLVRRRVVIRVTRRR